MSISTPFIFRPIATLLLTIGMALVGGVPKIHLNIDAASIGLTSSAHAWCCEFET